MRKYLLLLLLVCSNVYILAQTTISGTITDEKAAALGFATITIENPVTNAIIAFKVANSKGAYSITFTSSLKEVQVKFSLLNYESQVRKVENSTQTVNFTALVKPTQLEEVVVREGMVYRRGDTIVHDVAAYANKNDRTLSDVMRKMPGVEVEADGKIKYQGKDINQFMVDGKDLMQGQYGVIPNSIPFNDVSKVEVLENHQPVKMLKNKVPSENAAINIKLKKAVTMTGRGELGAGASPFLWNVKFTPMLFSKKLQTLLSFKSNNNGEEVGAELNSHFLLSGFAGLTKNFETANFLRIATSGAPASIPRSRYLFNKSHLLSANVLKTLQKDWELRFNNSFVYDDVERAGNQKNTIRSLDANGNTVGEVAYSRVSDDGFLNRKLRSEISINRNVSANYFKNNLIFQYNNRADAGNMWINQVPVNQAMQGAGYNIQNSLSTLLPLSRTTSRMLHLQSFVSYVQDPQLYVIDSLRSLQFTDQQMRQAVRLSQTSLQKVFNTENMAAIGFSWRKYLIMPSLGMDYSHSNFNTAIRSLQQDHQDIGYSNPWKNDLAFQHTKAKAMVNISRKTELFSIMLRLPFYYNHILAEDNNNDFYRKLSKPTLEPSLSFQYFATPKLTASISGGLSYGFSTPESLLPGFIFNQLNFNAYASDIAVRKITTARTGLEYKNLLLNITGNTNYSFSNVKSNIILSREIAPNGQQQIRAVLRDNHTDNHAMGLNLSKNFANAASSINLGYTASFNQSNIMLSNTLLPVKVRSGTGSMKLENSSLGWFIGSYTLLYNATRRSDAYGQSRTVSANHQLKTTFYPYKNHNIGASADWVQYTIAGQSLSSRFFDLMYRYAWDKRKIDFELKWNNILNTRTFEQVLISNLETSVSSYAMRPSQVMVAVKFNIR